MLERTALGAVVEPPELGHFHLDCVALRLRLCRTSARGAGWGVGSERRVLEVQRLTLWGAGRVLLPVSDVMGRVMGVWRMRALGLVVWEQQSLKLSEQEAGDVMPGVGETEGSQCCARSSVLAGGGRSRGVWGVLR